MNRTPEQESAFQEYILAKERYDKERYDAAERVRSAARDMLEALKTYVAHYPMGINPFLDDAYRAARAAIAKAEGK